MSDIQISMVKLLFMDQKAINVINATFDTATVSRALPQFGDIINDMYNYYENVEFDNSVEILFDYVNNKWEFYVEFKADGGYNDEKLEGALG